MSLRKICALAALLVAPLSQAAYVTIDEAGMDAVFSQAIFGARTVDIRIGAVTQIVAPTLLSLTTDGEVDALFALHVGPVNVVNFYFVDSVDSCGGFNVNIIGCGETPGNNFVVESVFADDNSIAPGGTTTVGVQLLSHELGHNLGLQHRTGNFLMNPSINGFGALNATERDIILASNLIQTDGNGQRFIQINPVLIVLANDVPEPSTLFLAFAGLLAAGVRSRKQPQPQLQS